MFRIRRCVMILFGLLILLTGMAQSVQASPNAIQCGPYVQPGICSPAFYLGDSVVIRPGVPFIWMRDIPSSNGSIVNTVFARSNANLRVISRDGHWDGYQSWYVVAVASDPTHGGWVEQASLQKVSDTSLPTLPPPTPNPSTKANWQVPMTATLRPLVYFAWLRNSPSSYATPVGTILAGATFNVWGVPNPVYDGVQWWWYVQYQQSSGTFTGWLEQNSIVPARTSATPIVILPSPTPIATTSPAITTTAAFQTFENGYMIWTGFDQEIYVLNGKDGGMFAGAYAISSYEGLPDNPVTEPAPNGLVKPIRGFGRVWGNFSWVRQSLGWAVQPEQGYTATMITSNTANGFSRQITLPDGRTIHILKDSWKF